MLLNQTLKIIAKSVTPGNTVFVVPARLDVVLTSSHVSHKTAPIKKEIVRHLKRNKKKLTFDSVKKAVI